MDREHVYTKLREFVSSEFLSGEDFGLDEETPLLEYGVLDSMSITLLSNHIDETFGVEIPDDKLTPENLQDLDSITDLVLRLNE